MADLTRRLLTLYPPLSVTMFCALQAAVAVEFPDAVLDYSEDAAAGAWHIVVTEHLGDNDSRLLGSPVSLDAQRQNKETT